MDNETRARELIAECMHEAWARDAAGNGTLGIIVRDAVQREGTESTDVEDIRMIVEETERTERERREMEADAGELGE